MCVFRMLLGGVEWGHCLKLSLNLASVPSVSDIRASSPSPGTLLVSHKRPLRLFCLESISLPCFTNHLYSSPTVSGEREGRKREGWRKREKGENGWGGGEMEGAARVRI